jgi:hypothetical protein
MLASSGISNHVNRRFGWNYHLHLQGWKSAEQETSVQKVASLPMDYTTTLVKCRWENVKSYICKEVDPCSHVPICALKNLVCAVCCPQNCLSCLSGILSMLLRVSRLACVAYSYPFRHPPPADGDLKPVRNVNVVCRQLKADWPSTVVIRTTEVLYFTLLIFKRTVVTKVCKQDTVHSRLRSVNNAQVYQPNV